MYPLEMNLDNNNIGYIDISNNDNIFPLNEFVNLDYDTRMKKPLKKDFYELASTSDYILKVNKDRNKSDLDTYRMIKKLIEKQELNNNVEFPIGYVLENDNVVGQIIRYYKNAQSLKNICFNEDLSSLQKYIYRDGDSLHNLFLVYLEILEQIEKLYDNGVGYIDVNYGNFVFVNNQIKIIDFENEYIDFSKMNYFQRLIIRNYVRMVNNVNEEFFLDGQFDYSLSECNFSDIKRKVKVLENKVRSSNR